jgi:hypothetical protein
MYSIKVFEKRIVSNLTKLKPISIIDGENFKFLPYNTKSEFLKYYSGISTLFFVSKSDNFRDYFKNNNNIYYFKLSLLDNNLKKNKKYCFDDSFCIYIANLLNMNNKNFKLFTNDKFDDYDNIIKKQDPSVIDFFENKYIFDSKNNLKNININLIRNNKQNFY